MLVKFSPYLIAMLIGLMIGAERERVSRVQVQSMGVRSFLLLALLGAIAAGIGQALISFGMVVFATVTIAIGYARSAQIPNKAKDDIGITTEIAAMTTFGLGFLAHYEPILSLALGAVILFILLNKTVIHRIVLKHLKPMEIQAAAVLLLLAVGVVPLLPNTTIDPWNIFNPRRFGVILSLIAGIQFLSYGALRIFGSKIGYPLSGVLSGTLSSTLAFATYPGLAKSESKHSWSIASAAAFATAATLAQLIILLAVISWRLSTALIAPLLILLAASTFTGIFFSKRTNNSESVSFIPKNPLQLLSAFRLAVILTIAIFALDFTQKYLGETFTNLLTFIGAMIELQGMAIAGGNMFANGSVDLPNACSIVLLAVSASMFSKILLTIFLGKGVYRRLILIFSISLFVLSLVFLALFRLAPMLLG